MCASLRWITAIAAAFQRPRDDEHLVEHIALQFIERYGTDAVDVLRTHADRAATEGD
jgi:hypothetical protein